MTDFAQAFQNDQNNIYTLKNKGASNDSSSDAIDKPFLVPQETIPSKVL